MVAASDNPKIARWWLLIWPTHKNSAGNLKKPHESELDAIWNHRQKLEIRQAVAEITTPLPQPPGFDRKPPGFDRGFQVATQLMTGFDDIG